jgi:tripartite ATP-independent transporter DctM subunit
VPPVVIIFAVLGSIMVGFATPTEAAATGAVGTLLLALLYRRLTPAILWDALKRSVRVSTMILTIILAGSVFAAVFAGSGGMTAVGDLIAKSGLGPWQTLYLILFIGFLAGYMLEPLVIILIMVPVAAPIMKAMGFDLVWFSVVFLVLLQTAYLTPPMAPAIFYLRGIAPPEIELKHMFTGIWPFIGLQVIVLVLVTVFPQTVLWLPQALR